MSNTSLSLSPSTSPALYQDSAFPEDTLNHIATLSPSVLHALALLFPYRYGRVSQRTGAKV